MCKFSKQRALPSLGKAFTTPQENQHQPLHFPLTIEIPGLGSATWASWMVLASPLEPLQHLLRLRASHQQPPAQSPTLLHFSLASKCCSFCSWLENIKGDKALSEGALEPRESATWELTPSLLGHTEAQTLPPHLLCSLGAPAAFRHKVCIPQELCDGTRESPVTEMGLSSFLDGPKHSPLHHPALQQAASPLGKRWESVHLMCLKSSTHLPVAMETLLLKQINNNN